MNVETPYGRHPFRVGQRVEMTDEARRAGLVITWRGKTVTTGKVVAVSTESRLGVKVLRDGLKTPGWYHSAFWKPVAKRRSPLRRRGDRNG